MNNKDHVWGWKSWLVLVIVCLITIWLIRAENNNVKPLIDNSSSVVLIPNTTKACTNATYIDGYWYCNIDDIQEVG